jgi:hypothetical protein
LIESIVTKIEMIAYHITSTNKSSTALTAYATTGQLHPLPGMNLPHAPYDPTSPFKPSRRPSDDAATGESGIDYIDFTASSNVSTITNPISASNGSGKGGGIHGHVLNNAVTGKSANTKQGLQSITESLGLLDSLRQDIEKVSVGITLATLSTNKLIDILTTTPEPNVLNYIFCCVPPSTTNAWMEVLTGVVNGASGSSSTHHALSATSSHSSLGHSTHSLGAVSTDANEEVGHFYGNPMSHQASSGARGASSASSVPLAAGASNPSRGTAGYGVNRNLSGSYTTSNLHAPGHGHRGARSGSTSSSSQSSVSSTNSTTGLTGNVKKMLSSVANNAGISRRPAGYENLFSIQSADDDDDM